MMEEMTKKSDGRGTLREIAKEFLRLGFVAYGGPAATHCRDGGALRAATRMADAGAFSGFAGSREFAAGAKLDRSGNLSGVAAGACFILPAALLVTALAWAYMEYGAMPQVAGLLFGIKPVVVALIAQAIWNLGRTALKSTALAILAICVVALAAWGIPVLVLLIGAGILWMSIGAGSSLAKTRAAIAGMIGTGAAGAGGAVGALPVFLYFLKIGAVLFGSDYVLLAVLRADLVAKLHWLSDAQLLDAIAVSQATPGPFFTVATFIGYILAGWRGAALATLGMFLP